MLEYREFVADEASPLQCVWELRGRALDEQRIAPDGRVELIAHLGDPFEELGPSGWEIQSEVLIAGQMTRPLFVRPTGITHTIGIRLKSWASGYILGRPASELTNRVIGAAGVQPFLAYQVKKAIAGSPVDLQRTACQFMTEIARQVNPDERVIAAVRHVELAHGCCPVEKLVKVAGVSERQLERLFHAHVGVGPKTLSRIRRFSYVFMQQEVLKANWADIASECGYADQSHLTRDFTQFAGAPPAALLSQPTDLALFFTAAAME